MDSKLKRLTLIGVLSALLLVFLLVVLVNSNRLQEQTAAEKSESSTMGMPSLPETNIVTGQIGNDLHAFLSDSTFFDKEDTYLSKWEDVANRLSLVVTSVEKDLRIQVVDFEGNLVPDIGFLVEIEGQGEYKDLDKDGVIYVAELPAGEYVVSLQPVEGYKVPLNGTKVKVKDQVEYLVIDDISLLVYTEEEINAEIEDTAEQISDVDKTEVKKRQSTGSGTYLGIDVSKWQKEIDWEKVAEDGVEFAIIRCGYRGSVSGCLVEDPYFERNIKGATAAGIKVGVYFFTQAITEVEAVEEASMVVSLIRDYELEYPVFIDTESAGGNGRADGLDEETRTAVCEAFCATVRNAGYQSGVYASRNWYNKRVDVERLEKYVIWLAEYRKIPLYEGYYHMWQYTSKGKVDGIDGNVDLNISYLGY
ncbi:MAG: glycoside hydrolase family 25 protein [Lachnospiraceae bacterium]|nr:glycoside hydrolase family 25 protein [Lachnospiraceae bacterium]